MTRVAERAQEHAHRGGRSGHSGGELGNQPQLLETLSAVKAVGVTPSVPTPASR